MSGDGGVVSTIEIASVIVLPFFLEVSEQFVFLLLRRRPLL
jgi:hypothetical protein